MASTMTRIETAQAGATLLAELQAEVTQRSAWRGVPQWWPSSPTKVPGTWPWPRAFRLLPCSRHPAFIVGVAG